MPTFRRNQLAYSSDYNEKNEINGKQIGRTEELIIAEKSEKRNTTRNTLERKERAIKKKRKMKTDGRKRNITEFKHKGKNKNDCLIFKDKDFISEISQEIGSAKENEKE
jgi:hypothetical protein